MHVNNNVIHCISDKISVSTCVKADVNNNHQQIVNNRNVLSKSKKTYVNKRRHRRGKKNVKGTGERNIKIGFNNVNRIKGKEYEISNLLQKENIQIFGIAETFLQHDNSVNIQGYKWLGKNRVNKGGGGIGFLVSNDVMVVDDNVFESKSDSCERLWLKVCIGDKPLYIAVVYFPVEGTDISITEEMYTQLLSEILKIERDDHDDPHILVLGDFNARIGDIIPFGDPVRNSNGERLLDFRDASDLVIINCTRLCKGKITWMRNNLFSTIDYFLGSNNLVNSIHEMIVDEDREFHLGSDHNVLLLNLNSSFGKTNKKSSRGPTVWDITKDQDWTNYQNEIENQFIDWDANSFEDPNTLWNSWKTKILLAANQTIGTRECKGSNKQWWDSNIDKLIKERRAASKVHRNYMKNNNGGNEGQDELWNEYQDKRKQVKSAIQKKIMQMRIDRSVKIANNGGPSNKDFWKSLKGCNNKQHTITSIKLPNSNTTTTNRITMNQTILHYWKTLGQMNLNMNDEVISKQARDCVENLSNMYDKDQCNYTAGDNYLLDINISIDDIIDAINLCKNNKSPGIDTITNELLKNGGESLCNSILKLFNQLLIFESIPDEWNKGIIIPIYKKGSKNDLNNYRGITLNSCVSKVFNRLISKVISSFLDDNDILTEIQGGFRKDHRCEDHILTVKSITATRLAEGKNTYMAFLDFRKAFDTVWRDKLLLTAWNIGIRGRVWKILSNLYNNVQSKVKFGDIETDFFDVSDGVKQGCVLSPILFSIYINEFANILRENNIGVNVNKVNMGCLFWADDVVLLANDDFELQRMLDLAAKFSEVYRLKFNHEKSNVLIVEQAHEFIILMFGPFP
ncbi:uncharacterized protein [Amphiura filiformis]|uniref:uncharacterized protein n=1 Tax=Amphiura filiformis TaxID=82378 RepID=UPI003B20BEDF